MDSPLLLPGYANPHNSFRDSLNNLERVYLGPDLDTPSAEVSLIPAGTYRVLVRGANVPMGQYIFIIHPSALISNEYIVA